MSQDLIPPDPDFDIFNLSKEIPDVEVILSLTPEELAAKILFMLRKSGVFLVHISYFEGQIDRSSSIKTSYPKDKLYAVGEAINEAWAWLVAQGLLVRAQNENGGRGWKRLSRRARSFENETSFADYAASRLLQRQILHPAIADAAWLSFMRGAYATAVFEAMRSVEIAVREAAHFSQGDHGVPMIRRAFHKDNGPLTDPNAQEAEKEALSNLFVGAIGSYKNPHSHRNVPIESPREAAEIVMLASHLLRIVDARVAAKEARDGS